MHRLGDLGPILNPFKSYLLVLKSGKISNTDSRHYGQKAHLAGYGPVRAMMLLNEEVVYPGKSVWGCQERLSNQVDLNSNFSSAN